MFSAKHTLLQVDLDKFQTIAYCDKLPNQKALDLGVHELA